MVKFGGIFCLRHIELELPLRHIGRCRLSPEVQGEEREDGDCRHRTDGIS